MTEAVSRRRAGGIHFGLFNYMNLRLVKVAYNYIVALLIGILLPFEGLHAAATVYEVDKCAALLGEAVSEEIRATWSPPAAITEVFRSMNKAKEKDSVHPDKISATEIDKLPPGAVIYLDAASVRNPKLKTSTHQSVKFEVVKTGPNAIWLFNPQFGELEFRERDFSDLFGNLYRLKGFRTRSPFLPGEFVQLGWPGSRRPENDLEVVNMATGEIETISNESLPWVGKFVRTLSTEEYEVEFPDFNADGPIRLKVKWNEVHHLGIGTGKTLRAVLEPLQNISYNFSINELVRYRDASGRMKEGIVSGENETAFLIDNSSGTFEVKKGDVFKTWGTTAPSSIELDTTDYYLDSSLKTSLEKPSGLLREVLDGAARLSSHPEFLQASDLDKIKILLVYQNILLPWKRSGNTLEVTGIKRFSQILCTGTGVCRHNTPLMAAVLSEAGISMRIYFRMMNEIEFSQQGSEFRGHTWLEVDLLSLSEVQTIVVDPSIRTVKPMTEVESTAAQAPASPDALWWSHRERKELKPRFLD